MKKISTLLVAVFLNMVMIAQRPAGFVVDNFKYTDINGKPVELYKLLDSGYSVLIDISAVWCAPCWNFHSSHTMKNLMDKYGPNGSIAPKKVYCVYIEGDASTAKSLLYGPKSSSTQGDWVTGANYPIIDTGAFNTELSMSGFPLLTLICPDRKIIWTQSGAGPTDISSTIYGHVTNGCGSSSLPATIDFGIGMASNDRSAGEFGYASVGDNFNSNVRFFNSSTTVGTSANFTVKYNSTNLKTSNWSGSASLKDSINKFGISSIQVQQISSGYLDNNYTVEVSATGDVNSANNSLKMDPLFVYSTANAKTAPFTLDYEDVDFANDKNLPLPSRYISSVTDQLANVYDNTELTQKPIGINGSETHCLAFNYVTNLNSVFYGYPFRLTLFNANIPNTTDTFLLSFDYSKRARTSSDLDTLRVFYIEGNTLTYLATFDNASLITDPSLSTALHMPTTASQWKTKVINLASLKGKQNVVLGFQFSTGKPGGYAWFDNVQLVKKSSGASNSSTFQFIAGDSVYKSDSKTNSSIKPTLKVKNIKGSNVAGKWKANVKMMPLDWTFAICDPELCHPDKATSGSFTQLKDSTNDFYVEFKTNKIDGDGLIELTVWNSTDSAASRVLMKFRVKQGSGTASIVPVSDAVDFYYNNNVLYLNKSSKPSRYIVYSLDGKTIQTANIPSNSDFVRVNDLPSGLYFIEVEFIDKTSQILKIRNN